MDWKKALVIDYTGCGRGDLSVSEYGAPVVEKLRVEGEAGVERVVIVLDTGHALSRQAPHMVRDHINLSGRNPLVGPNHPIGERFTVVNDIYVKDCPKTLNLDKVVTVGVAAGRKLNDEDVDFVKGLGADCYSHNVVPTMLIAAHAGWKVLAIVGPEGGNWQADCLDKIQAN
jgi:purine-nucleoside phosphorylase